MDQIIVIDDTGKATTMDHGSQGVDLRELGPVKHTRVSQILFDEQHQQHYVKFEGDLSALGVMTCQQLQVATRKREAHQFKAIMLEPGISALFEYYDQAVAAEKVVVNYVHSNIGTTI